MSAKPPTLDGDWVSLDDAHGHRTSIPGRVVHIMLVTANHNADGRAVWALRPFDKDTLAAAVELLDTRDLCAKCHDGRGTQDMGDGVMFCGPCCSAAHGTRHDEEVLA